MAYFQRKSATIKMTLLALACYAQGLSGSITPCNQMLPCSQPICGQGFIEGEFLYWRAHQAGLAKYTSSTDEIVEYEGARIARYKGKLTDPHFEWHPGYRIGAGYVSNTGWDIAAYYTDFRSRAQKKGDQENECWKLDFQVVDLRVGYRLDFSCISFRPFMGVRGAKIDQEHKRSHWNEKLAERRKMREYTEFGGVGPLFGVEANVNLGCGFSLFADVSTAILYGNKNIKSKHRNQHVEGITRHDWRQTLNSYQTVFDAGIGIAYDTCICDSIPITFKLGAEHHCYFNYAQCGDLSLDGGTFSATLKF